jgi:hypothetical protein
VRSFSRARGLAGQYVDQDVSDSDEAHGQLTVGPAKVRISLTEGACSSRFDRSGASFEAKVCTSPAASA